MFADSGLNIDALSLAKLGGGMTAGSYLGKANSLIKWRFGIRP